MKRTLMVAAALFGLSTSLSARAAILEDFQFNDAAGTALAGAANSANGGNQWAEDVADMTQSDVQAGSYLIKKANDNFGTNFLQIGNITSGKAWLVAEMKGWHFSTIIGPGEWDAAEPEEIRFDILDNDTGTSGSTVTAEVEIQRDANGGIELNGSALGAGSSNIAATQALNPTQSAPFILVLELDKTANTYTVYYKDGANPFATLGTGNVDPARNGNSIRFVVNNNFGGTGEFFDIDRIYLTDVNPIPEPASLALFALGGLALCRKPGRH